MVKFSVLKGTEKEISSSVHNKLLEDLKEGEEKLLCLFSHGAIVKKDKGKLKHLELQSRKNRGWKDMDLKRFRTKSSDKSKGVFGLFDYEQLDVPLLKTVMEYINTKRKKK